jgi:membrane protease YdiL (CAAX protease family)
LLAWFFNKIGKTTEAKSNNFIMWTSIIFASILFGFGHLPVTASLIEIIPIMVARAVILNGIGGIIFGWLYWRKGLESAIISHFSADVVLLVVLPLIVG